MELNTNLSSANENTEIIRENSQKIHSVLAAHQIALWEYDISTGKCSFADDYFRVLGLKKAGIVFEGIDDFYRFTHPEDLETYQTAFARMLASDSKTSQIMVRCIGEHGEVIWLEDHFLSYKGCNDGQPDKLLAYTVNVTSQCEKEQHIKYLEKHNRKIIEALPEFIFIFDENFFITDVLMAPGTILLHPVEVLRGADGRDIYSEEVSELFLCNIRECLQDGKLKEIEYPLEVDGIRHYFQARIAPFEGNKVLALIHDIGDRIRRSQELIEAKRRAEDADKMKSVFLANMSHEIRTPLNAIVGFSELMINCDDSSEKEEYMEIIQSNNELLLRLINDILDLSKIESGILERKPEKFNMSKVCSELYTMIQPKVTNPDVKFCMDESGPECLIFLDRNRLKQVWMNYLTNAVKCTQSGYIKMGYSIEGKGIRFYVEDSGVGIPVELQDRVFGRFQKLNEFAQGTGLGLAISRAIIEGAGGKVGFISQPGKGSTFWAWVPCEIEMPEKVSSVDSQPLDQPSVLNEISKEDLKILIAEDNDSNYLLVRHILKDYNLTRALDGADAVWKARNESFDLILMDMKMPVMGGLEATRRIREFNAKVPIIALTANAFDSDKSSAIEAGCNAFLAKPLSKKQLLEIFSTKW